MQLVFEAPGPGLFDVSLRGLPSGVHEDSVRVDTRRVPSAEHERAHAPGTCQHPQLLPQVIGVELARVDTHDVRPAPPQQMDNTTSPPQRVEHLRDAIRRVEQAAARAHTSLRHLEAFAHQHFHTKSEAWPDTEAVGRTLAWVAERTEHLHGELEAASRRKQDLTVELEKAQLELQRWDGASGGGSRYMVDVIVSVKVAAAGPVHLDVKYLTSDVSWVPAYDVRFDSTARELAVEYYAEVWQRTGEDWSDVELSLSTAAPSSMSTPPPFHARRVIWDEVLASQRVSFTSGGGMLHTAAGRPASNNVHKRTGSANVQRRRTNGAGGAVSTSSGFSPAVFESASDGDVAVMTGAGSAGDVSVMAGAAMPASAPQSAPPSVNIPHSAAVESSGFEGGVAVFHIHDRINVRSRHGRHSRRNTQRGRRVLMRSLRLPNASLSYEIYPASPQPHSAFRCVQVRHTAAYPLLPSSRAFVYVDGAFATRSHLPLTNTGGVLRMYLGSDNEVRVHVSAEDEVHSKENAHLLFNDYRQRHVVSRIVDVVNFKSSPVRLRLVSPIPASQDARIVVKMVDPPTTSLVRDAGKNCSAASRADPSKDEPGGARVAGCQCLGGGGTQAECFVMGHALHEQHPKRLESHVWVAPSGTLHMPIVYAMEWPDEEAKRRNGGVVVVVDPNPARIDV